MNRLAQGVVMLLLGGAVLRASVTDMYLRYVKETLQPFLIAASVVMLAAGAMTLWYELRRGGRSTDDGHGHHREPRVAWLLILPVLGLLLVSPPALGSYSVATAGSVLTEEQRPADFPPLPDLHLVELPVLDYSARAVWDDGRTLEGHRIQLSGFLTSDDEEQYLARLVVSCCAADARPIKVGMVGAAPDGVTDDTWVSVIGTYVETTGVDPINEATIAYIEVETWQEIEAPSRPYE